MSVQSERLVYRLYWVTGSGRIDGVARPIRAPCDDEAILQAESMAEGDRVELWLGARLVVQIAATTMPRPVS